MARFHERISRWARCGRCAAPLLVAVLVLSGCGEINDMLDAGKGEQPAPAAGKPAADTAGQSAKAKLDAYYKRESRQVAQDPNDPPVSCSLKGKRQFMRRSDCLLRGGHE